MARSVFGRPIVVVLASVILASCLIVALSGTALAASIQRVSVSSSGAQGNSGSDQASMSADARYVAFDSQATNLVPGRTAGGIYFRDLVSGTTQLIAAAAGPSVSATGRYVAFWSDSPSLLPDDTNGYANAFLWDRDTGAIERVSVSSAGAQSNAESGNPCVSADGRYVFFWSRATNLVTGDANNVADVFVHDRQSGTTTRVSVATGGTEANGNSYTVTPTSISSDGRSVVFESDASNLVTGDTNGSTDIFVRDTITGSTVRVSVATDGTQGNGTCSQPSISADGRYVGFISASTNIGGGSQYATPTAYVHDMVTGTTTKVGSGQSDYVSMSPDGHYVVYGSGSFYVTNLSTGATRRASESLTGTAPDYPCNDPSVSTDGTVIFDSLATNLVPGDTNGAYDVFLSQASPPPTIVSVSPALGPTLGGNNVVITGTNFLVVSSVHFGSVNAESYTVNSSTQITAVAPGAPGGSAGAVQLSVTTESGTAASQYTFVAAPTLTSISPARGLVSGGSSVVITGTGFKGIADASLVSFGGVSATSFTVDSATQITATTPAHAAGVVQVRVTAAGGTTADTDSGTFLYTPVPTVTDDFPPVRITNNSYYDSYPQVSGDRIVWLGASDTSDPENYQVYSWTPAEGITLLSTTSKDNPAPQVSGDRVVWWGSGGSDGGSDGEIFTWTPATGLVQLTKNAGDDQTPQVSGDRVVWAGQDGTTYQVYTWTPSGRTKKVSASTHNVIDPVVSGNRISWVDGTVVYSWTAATGAVAVSELEDPENKTGLCASGERLVWISSNNLYTWTATGGPVRIAQNLAGGKPDVSGDRIVWGGSTGSYHQVFTWTPAAGTVQLTAGSEGSSNSRVSGDRVVWESNTTSGAEILSWSPAGGVVQIASSPGSPAVSGDRVVWSSEGEAASEIYTVVPQALPQFEDTDPHITYSPAASWAPYSSTSASRGDYERANTSNSSATVYFNGTELDWIAMKGTTTGKADVYLDDTLKGTVDLSAASATYKVNVWSTGTIASGLHKFSIVWNSNNAAGKYITLDRVDVQGTLVYPPPAITSLSPSSGSTADGTTVTINGTGFGDVSSVTFDGTSVPYTVDSNTKITATAPAHSAGTVRVEVTTASGSTPDTAADDFTYSVAPPTTRVDVPTTTSAGLTTSGTWTAYTSASAYGGSYLRSSTAGAYAVLTFQGTRLDWITMKGTTGAIADVYVDGSSAKAATVNLYASPAVYQQNLFSTGTLPDGYHTVKIVRDAGSVSGRYLTIDAVQVAGSLLAPARTEESASPSPFTWNPASWTLGSTTSASGGSYRYTNTAGAYASFSFTGVGFRLIGKTASSYGNLTVTIDGVSQTVSLYSSATTYKKTVLIKFLALGAHTVKIARAGTKSTSSTGYTIDLDAIDLWGVMG